MFEICVLLHCCINKIINWNPITYWFYTLVFVQMHLIIIEFQEKEELADILSLNCVSFYTKLLSCCKFIFNRRIWEWFQSSQQESEWKCMKNVNLSTHCLTNYFKSKHANVSYSCHLGAFLLQLFNSHSTFNVKLQLVNKHLSSYNHHSDKLQWLTEICLCKPKTKVNLEYKQLQKCLI